MHTPIEDLLNRREERMRDSLRALPELAPPSEAWSDIRAAARVAVLARSARRRRWAVGLAAAFVSAALVLGWQWSARRGPEAQRGQAVAGTAGQGPGPAESVPAPDYGALRAESARLERLLLQLPRGGQVMSASTAGTIVGLEDQVAYIDERLTFAAADGSRSEYRQALWRERVDVMNALVQVRYAQAQSAGY